MYVLPQQSAGAPAGILDMASYNGRVDVASPEDADARFRMFERTSARNTASDQSRPLMGNGWEANVLAQVFFSAENIQIIQNGLRAGVFALSANTYVLPNQSLDALQIIMRSIYSQHARHSPADIAGQVAALNELVLDYAVPNCYGSAVAHLRYLRDQSSLPVPLERPQQPDRDRKQLELKPWF